MTKTTRIDTTELQARANKLPQASLVGALVLIPMILAYTFWAYWVFRGKVGEHGYH